MYNAIYQYYQSVGIFITFLSGVSLLLFTAAVLRFVVLPVCEIILYVTINLVYGDYKIKQRIMDINIRIRSVWALIKADKYIMIKVNKHGLMDYSSNLTVQSADMAIKTMQKHMLRKADQQTIEESIINQAKAIIKYGQRSF